MRARRERAVAHAALLSLSQSLAKDGAFRSLLTPAERDLFRTAFSHTRPRPWLSAETRRTLTVLAIAVGIIVFVVLVAGSAPTVPRPYPNPTLTAPAVHR